MELLYIGIDNATWRHMSVTGSDLHAGRVRAYRPCSCIQAVFVHTGRVPAYRPCSCIQAVFLRAGRVRACVIASLWMLFCRTAHHSTGCVVPVYYSVPIMCIGSSADASYMPWQGDCLPLVGRVIVAFVSISYVRGQ